MAISNNRFNSVRLALSCGVSLATLIAPCATRAFAETAPVVPTNNGQASGSQTKGDFSPNGQDQLKNGFCGQNGRGNLPNVTKGSQNSSGDDGSTSGANSGCNSFSQWAQTQSDANASAKLQAALKTGDSKAIAEAMGGSADNSAVQFAQANPKQALAVLTSVKTGDADSKSSVLFKPTTIDQSVNKTDVGDHGTGFGLRAGIGINVDVFGRVQACDSRLMWGNGATANVTNDLRKHLKYDREAWSRFYDKLRDQFIAEEISEATFNAKMARWKIANSHNLSELRAQYGDSAVNAILSLCAPAPQPPVPVTPPGVPPVTPPVPKLGMVYMPIPAVVHVNNM